MQLQTIEQKQNKLEKKKGNINLILTSTVLIGVTIMVLVLVLVMAQKLVDTQATTSEAYRAGNKSIYGLGKFSDYVELLVIGIVAVVLISLIVGLLVFRAAKSGR